MNIDNNNKKVRFHRKRGEKVLWNRFRKMNSGS